MLVSLTVHLHIPKGLAEFLGEDLFETTPFKCDRYFLIDYPGQKADDVRAVLTFEMSMGNWQLSFPGHWH